MNNSDDAEKLFAMMRKHFGEDPEENLETLRECGALMDQDPHGALKKALLVIHNMKGSAQTVGFLNFAAMLHETEEILNSLQLGADTDHIFSQLIDGIEAYFHTLAETLEDLPGLDKDCRLRLAHLAGKQNNPPPPAEIGWGIFEETSSQSSTVVPVSQQSSVETKTHAESGKYLLLEQNERLFAIHLDEVKEIVSNHVLNPLPNPQKGLRGMIVVRNRALPVLDLGVVIEGRSDDDRICAVICEAQEQSFAFRVQNPRQVISLRAQDFENVAEKNMMQVEHQNLIKNVANYNGQSVLIVDLKSMLAS